MPDKPLFQPKTSSFLPITLIVLGLAAGVLFYFQLIKPGRPTQIDLTPELRDEIAKLRKFKNLKLNFSIFDSQEFKNLRIFGDVPVRPSPGGKTDLFQ